MASEITCEVSKANQGAGYASANGKAGPCQASGIRESFATLRSPFLEIRERGPSKPGRGGCSRERSKAVEGD